MAGHVPGLPAIYYKAVAGVVVIAGVPHGVGDIAALTERGGLA